MNRCIAHSYFSVLRRLWQHGAMALLAWACINAPAYANTATRQFHQNVQRAEMQMTAPPQLLLDGKPARLSPGARIRNTNNILLMSASLVGQKFTVNYLRDPVGLIHEVWILTPEEARQPLPARR
jgi:hypothetical protein